MDTNFPNHTYNSGYSYNSNINPSDVNYYNYNYYNVAPPTIQNLDPRLNYVSQAPPPYLHPTDQPKYDLSLQSPVAELEPKTDDELYIETWLSKIGKIQINLDSTIEIIKSDKRAAALSRKPVKISVAKASLRKSLLVIKKLQDAENDLQTNFSTLSSVEWKNKTMDVNNLKRELSMLMCQFEDVDNQMALKNAVEKRRKKRTSQNRKKIGRRKQRLIEVEERKGLHKEIDQWLENMKEAVEKVKMKEDMQKDADCVLAEVTKKKSDARKQLSLIAALIKLRNLRESFAIQRGERVSLEDRSAFNKITEKLTNTWEDISKVYGKEELGLKIMLEKNTSGGDKGLYLSKDERVIQAWNQVLFGRACISTPVYLGLTLAEKDMETFVAIRRSWDTFLSVNDVEGTKIPVGWLLPSANPSTEWTKYLSD